MKFWFRWTKVILRIYGRRLCICVYPKHCGRAELVFERVEADIDNEVEVFIHKDSESTGNSSDAESHES